MPTRCAVVLGLQFVLAGKFKERITTAKQEDVVVRLMLPQVFQDRYDLAWAEQVHFGEQSQNPVSVKVVNTADVVVEIRFKAAHSIEDAVQHQWWEPLNFPRGFFRHIHIVTLGYQLSREISKPRLVVFPDQRCFASKMRGALPGGGNSEGGSH